MFRIYCEKKEKQKRKVHFTEDVLCSVKHPGTIIGGHKFGAHVVTTNNK